MCQVDDSPNLKVSGMFSVEIETFASEDQLAKLKASDPTTVDEFQRIIGEQAQETVNWGDTPFVITEAEFPALKGVGFEPKETDAS